MTLIANDEVGTAAESITADRTSAVVGSVLGTAVGDALGLPYENLSPRRAKRMLGPADRYRFFFRRGFVSDDTEHTCMMAQALLASEFDPNRFQRSLAKRLKWWLARLPAGTGKATARAIFKLWLGFSPANSGVFSAGNGPAMRSAILGAALDDVSVICDLARRSAVVTHSDPKAEHGAIVVALAAYYSRTADDLVAAEFLDLIEQQLPDTDDAGELMALLWDVVGSVDSGESTCKYATRVFSSRGVTGYTYETVPAAIHAWLSSPNDFASAVAEIISCGGDADTTAAIVGGIVGARVGRDGIPESLLRNLAEWPCNVAWMTDLATRLAERRAASVPRTPAIRQCVRNLLFLAVVLFHGFTRLAPPW